MDRNLHKKFEHSMISCFFEGTVLLLCIQLSVKVSEKAREKENENEQKKMLPTQTQQTFSSILSLVLICFLF